MYLVTNLDHDDPEAKAFIEGAFEKVKPLVFFSLSSVTMDFSKLCIVYNRIANIVCTVEALKR